MTKTATRTSVSRTLPWVAWSVFALVLAYLILVPLVRLLAIAFEDSGEGFARANEFGAWDSIGTTVLLAVGSVVMALTLGTALAWASLNLPQRWRFLSVVPILPIVVPAVAWVTGWSFLLSPGPGYLNALLRLLPWWSGLTEGPINVYSVPWIVILTGFSLTSFAYLFVSAGLQNIGGDLLEAARTSGSGQHAVFFTVVLPLLRPSLVYGGSVVLLLGLGQFTAPLLLGRIAGVDVLTTEMYRAVSQTPSQYGAAAAISLPLVILGLALVGLQKFVLGDQSRFVTHGGKGFRASGRPSSTAAVSIMVYFIFSTILPLLALMVVALSPFWTSEVRVDLFSFKNFAIVLSTPRIWDSVLNSVTISVIAVLITIPLGFAAATLLHRGRRFRALRAVVDLLVALPLTVPAVIFGVGFLLTYAYGPIVLYGTKAVMVLVYVTLMVPFSTRMQLAGMIALGDGYVEAARTSGASALRTNLQIIVPLLRSSIGGAAALMFVLLTHEFAASLLVRSPATQVMGTALYDLWNNGTYPLVAALAIVMTIVTGAGVCVALVVGGRDSLSKL